MSPSRKLPVPIAAEVARHWERWNSPAARHHRRKERTSRALTLWVVVALLFGIAAVAGSVWFTAGVVVFGALGVRSGLRLRYLIQTGPPAARPALPPPTSTAFPPMQRLAEAESSLGALLTQLADARQVSEVEVRQARATADDAAGTLRMLAGKIEAVERARSAAPDRERAAMELAVTRLGEQLDDGLDGYGSLVAAAASALAATATDLDSSQRAISDATDRLAGLAIALRELEP